MVYGLVALCLAASSATLAAPKVALVRGTYVQTRGGAEGETAFVFFQNVEALLDRAGVQYTPLSDEDVAAGKLAGAKVAIFAYTPLWAPGEAAALVDFVKAGGKALTFYTVPDEVVEALGFRPTGYVRDARKVGIFDSCKLAPDAPALEGLPGGFLQQSWNIDGAEPARPDAHVLYRWEPKEGSKSAGPAVLISDSGVYMTHVLTQVDRADKTRFLFALVAHYLPGLWPRAARRALDTSLSYDAFGGLDDLSYIVARAEKLGYANDPGPSLARTREAYDNLKAAVDAKHYARALALVAPVRAAATETYARCQPSREDEMRAVWIQTAFGVDDWGWQKSIRRLKQMGFNAIFPCMCWGGVAYYDSKVLPVSPEIKGRGDQLAECLKWCHKYGIECDVWMVCWNLGGSRTPEWFREKLRKEGRLQEDPEGHEIDWLCPSDDRNFRLERDAMIELVRKYHVDGIHFDYIRYPSMKGCYCPRCRAKFEARVGHKVAHWPQDVITGPLRQEWLQFRRDQITRLVRAVAEETHRIDPHCKVSAAVFPLWQSARDSVGQDWVKWVDKGWLDFVCPMDYNPHNDSFGRTVAAQTHWVDGRIPLYSGIGEWELRDAAQLLYQTHLSRSLGADGFLLFHYNHPELTGERMEMMRLGVTRVDALYPHRAPKVTWVTPRQEADLPPNTFVYETPIEVEAHLDQPLGRPAALDLSSVDGERRLRLADLGPDQTTVKVRLVMRQEPARLVISGRDQAGKLLFEARSPILWSISKEQHAQLLARRKPPVFAGTGLAVGVYQDSYGGPTILDALRAMPGVDAMPVYSLGADFLKPCQAVILPQPKNPSVLTPEAVQGLRAFVEAGGTLIVTHDAVGYRLCPVIVPEVCRGGIDRAEQTQWKLALELPAEARLSVGNTYQQTFFDHIIVSPGPEGHVVATDEEGRDLVVEGPYGKGRFCACGLALGLGKGDADGPVGAAEASLLRGLLVLLSH